MNPSSPPAILLFILTFGLSTDALSQVSKTQALTSAKQSASELNVLPQDLSGLRVSSQTKGAKGGYDVFYLQQTVNGIGIHNAVLTLAFDTEGEILSRKGKLEAETQRRSKNTTPALSALQALDREANALGYDNLGTIKLLEAPIGSEMKGVLSKGNISQSDIPFKLVYQTHTNGDLILCWEYVIHEQNGQNWWQTRLDASNGKLIDRNNWMIACNFDHTKSGWAPCGQTTGTAAPHPAASMSSTENSYRVYDLPIESPSHGNRTLSAAPWSNAAGSPLGWHDTDGIPGHEYTITRGNNVYASEDADGDNVPGYSPDGGTSLSFDFPIDLTQDFSTYQDALITNLFYWNNICHDILFNFGFDEGSGNFQTFNYGNTGFGNDHVLADAIDGSGSNNANFGTPPDGNAPRMQMYPWTSGSNNYTVSVNGTGYIAKRATFGAQSGVFSGGITIAEDGTSSPNLACNPITNGAEVEGNFALIDRGECAFIDKVMNAQNAGAIGVIVVQNISGEPFEMGGEAGLIVIPSVMVSLADGLEIKNAIEAGDAQVSLALEENINRTSGDLDNGIIVHEYAHGWTNRLTGGPNNVGCLNNDEQMGEGWSDYLGLLLTMEPGDDGTDIRGVGTYVLQQPINGGGIRSFPYSYDLNVNPQTYNSIISETIPHGVGSVWCTMLWDMTWLLVDQYGFDSDWYNGTGGNNIALQLVSDGLKLQPCDPGFVDARDAILNADQINNGGVNQCLIWEAFARRGLGQFASQGSRSSRTDGTESYESPCDCENDANQNGICDEAEVEGCTDAEACNYNDAANVDNGACDHCSCLQSPTVAAGFSTNYLLSSHGSLTAWGDNNMGQTTLPQDLPRIAKADAAEEYVILLDEDGNVIIQGGNGPYSNSVPAGLQGMDVAAGRHHMVVVKTDGSLLSLGANYTGLQNEPVVNNAIKGAAGWHHNAAILDDGSVIGWGDNWTAPPTPIVNAVAIDAGVDHTLVLRNDKTIEEWGTNINSSSAWSDLTNVVDIAAGGEESLAILSDGSLRLWRASDGDIIFESAPGQFVLDADVDWASAVALLEDGSLLTNLTPPAEAMPFSASWDSCGVCLSDADHDGICNADEDACNALENLPVLTAITLIEPASGPQTSDGQLEMEITGGSPAFLELDPINGSGGQTIPLPADLDQIAPGYYLASVIDASGCLAVGAAPGGSTAGMDPVEVPLIVSYSVCCGGCGIYDADADGICDDEDNCTDRTASNYADPANVPCGCNEPVEYQGYAYDVVQIGAQCWFSENLRIETYRNGDPIPFYAADAEWSNAHQTSEGAWCHPNGDASKSLSYGHMYNHWLIMDGREVCPHGWHVPTDGDFIELEMFMGMSLETALETDWRGADQGVRLKASPSSSIPWDGTDEVGFQWVQGGWRHVSGAYGYIDDLGLLMFTPSAESEGAAYGIRQAGNQFQPGGLVRSFGGNAGDGRSLRCVRD